MADKKISVGFIGLGIMGLPMAQNILKANFKLTVYNRTASKAQCLADKGANVASSPAEVAAASDIIVTCVSDTPDVLEVVLGEETGIISGIKKDAIVIDCSTVSPEVAEKCAAKLGSKGAGFLDAPVSGGDVGAKAGTLSIMVGGERQDFDRALPVLEVMGKTITYCGKSGSGYIVKLCNQILVSLNCLAAAEALYLAKAANIEPEAMLTAVSGGAAGSWQLSNLGTKMKDGDFSPGFFVDYLTKDLRLAHEACDKLGLNLRGALLGEELFKSASELGFGKEGTQAIYKVVEKLQKF